jgi:hypothetical protein
VENHNSPSNGKGFLLMRWRQPAHVHEAGVKHSLIAAEKPFFSGKLEVAKQTRIPESRALER